MASRKVSVVLNAFRRTELLEAQIQAIEAQTVRPLEILLWGNDASEVSPQVMKSTHHALSNRNFGVWARFAYALNARGDFICVFDDDTIPGRLWFENCLTSLEQREGLLGTRGLRFVPSTGYRGGSEFGWNAPNDALEQVDIVGHSWFFRREWLSHFWGSQAEAFNDPYVGEDMHLSFSLQKYAGLPTFVPPHPASEPEMFGSNPSLALQHGTDHNAISMKFGIEDKMQKALSHYRSHGFRLVEEMELGDGVTIPLRKISAARKGYRLVRSIGWKLSKRIRL